MDIVKNSILLTLAIFVLFLTTAGEYANNLLEAKAQVSIDLEEEDEDANSAELSFDIFNSVIQVSHLVFHSDLIFEFDFPEINETKAHSIFNTTLIFTNFYKTLFRSIISPNAP